MRISGNYIDRLLIYILPWTIIPSLIIHLSDPQSLKRSITVFALLTSALWIMDSVLIFFKFRKPKALRTGPMLIWGETEIQPSEISEVVPVMDKRLRWSFQVVEFTLTNGTKFYVIDKPRNFLSDILGQSSKTVEMLTREFPELITKIKPRRFT